MSVRQKIDKTQSIFWNIYLWYYHEFTKGFVTQHVQCVFIEFVCLWRKNSKSFTNWTATTITKWITIMAWYGSAGELYNQRTKQMKLRTGRNPGRLVYNNVVCSCVLHLFNIFRFKFICIFLLLNIMRVFICKQCYSNYIIFPWNSAETKWFYSNYRKCKHTIVNSLYWH